jgi:hypothetical protein
MAARRHGRARQTSSARCCPCTSHHVECGGLPPLFVGEARLAHFSFAHDATAGAIYGVYQYCTTLNSAFACWSILAGMQ